LQADALEQLGYQAESGPWRNFYLTGAWELREGVASTGITATGSSDVIAAMSLEMVFDYMAVRLNGPKAEGKTISVRFTLTDTGEDYLLTVENGVLNYAAGRQGRKSDVGLTLTRAALNDVLTQESTVQEKLSSGDIVIDGNPEKLAEMFGLMDDFDPMFNIVTP
jgi:alkyl sulfatase BDS1-like metallo-beta-lactamase superfamily hydrolase